VQGCEQRYDYRWVVHSLYTHSTVPGTWYCILVAWYHRYLSIFLMCFEKLIHEECSKLFNFNF
jgi:hypothetical protein